MSRNTPPPQPELPDNAPPKTVLVVDDDELFRNTLKTALTGAGYRALTAINGTQAVDRLSREEVDILVIDILMPEKDGLETLREVRRMKHKAAIVTMSGGGQLNADFFNKSARYLGASATLQKPFTLEELLSVLNAL
jgi:DNA-binding response OmpR family regulator